MNDTEHVPSSVAGTRERGRFRAVPLEQLPRFGETALVPQQTSEIV